MSDKDLFERRLQRERLARKQAEQILEQKAAELFEANSALIHLNEDLEVQVRERSKELADSEERYRNLVESAVDIFFNVDDEGYFTYMNEPGIQRFGFSEDEVIGHRYVEFVPESHQLEVFEYYTRMKDEKVGSDYYEFPILSKRGELFWIGQNVSRMKDKEGAYYFSAVARDITQRKNAELALQKAKEALIKSEVKYRSLIENMELGLLEVDNDGIIIKAYDHFNQMTGYEPGELVGRVAQEVLAVPGYEGVVQNEEEKRLEGETSVYEMKVLKKTGEELWMLISGAPFYDEKGNVAGSLGIHYDITERKNLEFELHKARDRAQKAQNAEKQFLANMSHEIRTPLNAIIGMGHLLQDTSLNQEQEEYLNILSSSASMLKNLISDILDMSKIDAGTLERQDKEFDLGADLENLVSTFKIKNEKPNLEFICDIDPILDRTVITDQQMLNQVLLNLLSNSDKFTESGSVSMCATVLDQKEDHWHLLLEVKDTGIGIRKEEVESIFQDFKQANQKIRTKYGGTGLGLSISKKLLDLLGAQLKVKSEVGKGSNFYFEIEVGVGKELSKIEHKRKDLQGMFVGKNASVLVVEDNPMNVKYLSRLLAKWQLQYSVCNNGQEALDYYSENHADIILMDLQMPVMDGFTATRLIRKMPGEKGEVPIIALTASTFLSKKQMAEEAGMTDFLSKPFTPDQLSKLLSKYLTQDLEEFDESHSFSFNDQLDISYLQEAYESDTEYAEEMFALFLELWPKELETINEVIKGRDESKLKQQIHKMKPTFQMVGLTNTTEEFQRLENAIGKGPIQSIINRLKKALEQAINDIELVKAELTKLQSFNQSEV